MLALRLFMFLLIFPVMSFANDNALAMKNDALLATAELTYQAEGHDHGPYNSLIAHVPSENSGITIGRGYDLKYRSKAQVLKDLNVIGMPKDAARAYANALGLTGTNAKAYLQTHSLSAITPAQQEKLFKLTYADYVKTVKRIIAKPSVTEKYGKTDWKALNPKIKTVLVDLAYRGDYTEKSRKIIQPYIAANDLQGFSKAISERGNWPQVPTQRFAMRVNYLENA